MGITEATVEEIKARVDLVDLVSSYGLAVKTAGATKKACCPFHNEKTPSFHINENKGYYHCFGCGESGDAIKFVQKMEGLTFVEAVTKLAEQVGVKIEAKEDPAIGRRKRLLALLAELTQFYHRCLAQIKEAELARSYLKERALDGAIQTDYLLGYAPAGVAHILTWAKKHGYTAEELEEAGVIKGPNRPGDSGYHRFGGRLMFPIKDKQGRVVGFSGRQLVASKNSGKYVNSPETPVFKKSNVLYGFDRAAGAITKTATHEAIVCEGQIDCIRLQTSGFPNAVAGQGTAFTQEHVKMLKRAADQVVLVYDDDGAGHKATVKSARLCLAAELPVRVVSLPGGDDPDSFLRTHPAADFQKMLDEAQSIMSFQIRTERAKEAHPDSVDAVNRITKEILLTIATCPSAILKATMVTEAAKLLGLPSIALQEELGKVRVTPEHASPTRTDEAPRTEDSPDGETAVAESAEDAAPLTGEDAKKAIPPSKLELGFCEFLLANEYAADVQTLSGMVGEFLPCEIFAHDFTRTFVETWRTEIAKGEDLIAPWSETLSPAERGWFDRLLTGQAKTLESTLSPTDLLENFIRSLWVEHLRRLRGDLPALGDATSDQLRLKSTLALKRLPSAKWSSVKEIIRDWINRQAAS